MMLPKDENELAHAIMSATSPLAIQGGGTRGANPVGEALNTKGMSGITLYDSGALTMVAQAGTDLSDIEAALDAEGQRLAFEPIDMRPLLGTQGTPTIGGLFATNASGPRRVAVGAARDFLLGVRFVDGAGNIVKNGGRVMKNVTGYDLVKLMAGSWGTLGVLSEVSFKVLPKPETQGLISIPALTIDQAVKAMSKALGSPYEITGAAHLTETANDVPDTILRVEGSETSVLYRLNSLKKLLGEFGEVLALQTEKDNWAYVRDVTHWSNGEEDVWRISVKPSDAPNIIKRLPKDARTMLDWGGGLIWAAVSPNTDVRAMIHPFDGHATYVRGSGDIPKFQQKSETVSRLSKLIRKKFDPRGIFNKGLMG